MSRRDAFAAGKRDALAGLPPDPNFDSGDDEFAYDRGYQAGLNASDDTSSPAGRDGSAPAKRNGSKAKSSSKRSSSSRRRPAKARRSTAARQAGRQLTAPARKASTSALVVVGTAAAVAAAYNFLDNAEAVGGFFGGIASALRWLDDPTKSIPYRSPS